MSSLTKLEKYFRRIKYYLERFPDELYRNSIKDLIEGNNKHIVNKFKALKFIKINMKNIINMLNLLKFTRIKNEKSKKTCY